MLLSAFAPLFSITFLTLVIALPSPANRWFRNSTTGGGEQHHLTQGNEVYSLQEPLVEESGVYAGSSQHGQYYPEEEEVGTDATSDWFNHHYEQTKETVYEAASTYLEFLLAEEARLDRMRNGQTPITGPDIPKRYISLVSQLSKYAKVLKGLHKNAKWFVDNAGCDNSTRAYNRMKKHERELALMLKWAGFPNGYEKREKIDGIPLAQHFYQEALLQRQRVEKILDTYKP